MTKKNVETIQTMCADFLQYRYSLYLRGGKRDADWNYYEGACDMLAAFGAEWRRFYSGDDVNDIKNYSHVVWFPDAERCKRLNVDAWKI